MTRNTGTIIIMRTFLLLIILVVISCNTNKHKKNLSYIQKDSVVYAYIETDPVLSVMGEDAADDPAIWYNSKSPEKSLVIGTNKKAGLHVYNLDGKELFFAPAGLVNNVDIRYGFELANGQLVDIVAATNRTDNSLTLMVIDGETGHLSDIAARKVYSKASEVYGFALYHNKSENKYFALIGGKLGEFEQYELIAADDNKIDAVLIRSYQFPSQIEGIVADDELGYLYVGEENHCIWKADLNSDNSFIPQKLAMSDSTNPKISYDIEGLTIYYAENHQGYLIASIQGSYSYALFTRNGSNKYLGSFTIKEQSIDAVEETDGLDVINLKLDDKFENGLLVVQDGFNYDADSLKTQNFKLVAWEKIAGLMEPQLIIDNQYRIQ